MGKRHGADALKHMALNVVRNGGNIEFRPASDSDRSLNKSKSHVWHHSTYGSFFYAPKRKKRKEKGTPVAAYCLRLPVRCTQKGA